MVSPYQQLDKRFARLMPLAADAVRPPRGWIRAIRTALGMTTGQLARRLGVAQPRIIELERGEADGNVTLKTLQRAAEALGCRLVYVLVPERPLEDTLRERASLIADRQFASVEQTMRLEAQEVHGAQQREETRRRLADEFLSRPARLWDEP
jgi:predicted DNA-binding mobile mystery protein A